MINKKMANKLLMDLKTANALQMKVIWALTNWKRYKTMDLLLTCLESPPKSTWTPRSIIRSKTPSSSTPSSARPLPTSTFKTVSPTTKAAQNLGCRLQMITILRVVNKKWRQRWSIWIIRYPGRDWFENQRLIEEGIKRTCVWPRDTYLQQKFMGC